MFNKNSVQIQAQFDSRVGDKVIHHAGFMFFDGELNPVDPNEAQILVGFVPNCVFTARDGNLKVIPRDSETVTGGAESDRNTDWVRGGWLAAIRTKVLGQEVQHTVFGRVGHFRGLEGGHRISAPSMERGGAGTLEQLLTDTVQRVSAHFWAHRSDFFGTDVGLEDVLADLSGLLGHPIRLDLNVEKEDTSRAVWLNEEGEEVQRAAVSDQRRKKRQPRGSLAGIDLAALARELNESQVGVEEAPAPVARTRNGR